MASDRATLANVVQELAEANKRLNSALLLMEVNTALAMRMLRQAQMRLYYCEGRILGLLAESLPSVVQRDAIDEASAEVGETWD